MEKKLSSAEEFFEDVNKWEHSPLLRVSNYKMSDRRQVVFDAAKVKMVMRVKGCGREEALRIVENRIAELRVKENTCHNAHKRDLTK